MTLHVPARRMQYWSAAEDRWVMPKDARPLYVAASSRDVRLSLNASSAK